MRRIGFVSQDGKVGGVSLCICACACFTLVHEFARSVHALARHSLVFHQQGDGAYTHIPDAKIKGNVLGCMPCGGTGGGRGRVREI